MSIQDSDLKVVSNGTANGMVEACIDASTGIVFLVIPRLPKQVRGVKVKPLDAVTLSLYKAINRRLPLLFWYDQERT